MLVIINQLLIIITITLVLVVRVVLLSLSCWSIYLLLVILLTLHHSQHAHATTYTVVLCLCHALHCDITIRCIVFISPHYSLCFSNVNSNNSSAIQVYICVCSTTGRQDWEVFIYCITGMAHLEQYNCHSATGESGLDINYVRWDPNGTNMRLFKISFSTFWRAAPKCTETDLKKSQICPIWFPSDVIYV